MSLKRLLVAIDGSAASSAALDFAIHRATLHDADLTIVYVLNRGAVAARASGPYGSIDPYPMVRAIEEQAGAVLAAASARALHDGVRATTLLLDGEATHQVLERARSSSADAIVLGTHGRSGVARLAFGSVAEGVLRASGVPVFVVREGSIVANRISTILVATDGSEASIEAGRNALELARNERAEVVFCTVVDPNELRWSRVEYTYEPDRCLENIEREAVRLLEHTLLDAEPYGVSTRSLPRLGSTSDELLAAAREVSADLIALGTHGRNGLNRFLLGSVAESVLRRSEVPVCTVRPQPLAWQAATASRERLAVS